MGILKYAILGAIGFALLPTPPTTEATKDGHSAPVASVENHELFSALVGTFADVATFCGRQPATCETMTSVVSVADAKARHSFKLVYEWANEVPANAAGGSGATGISDLLDKTGTAHEDAGSTTVQKQSAADPLITGSTTVVATADEGANTLRIDDLIPDWRGPEPASQA